MVENIYSYFYVANSYLALNYPEILVVHSCTRMFKNVNRSYLVSLYNFKQLKSFAFPAAHRNFVLTSPWHYKYQTSYCTCMLSSLYGHHVACISNLFLSAYFIMAGVPSYDEITKPIENVKIPQKVKIA